MVRLLNELKYFFRTFNNKQSKIILLCLLCYISFLVVFFEKISIIEDCSYIMGVYFEFFSLYTNSFIYVPLYLLHMMLIFKYLVSESVIIRFSNSKSFFLNKITYIFISTFVYNFTISLLIFISLVLKTNIEEKFYFIISFLFQQMHFGMELFTLGILMFGLYNLFKIKIFSFIITYCIIAIDFGMVVSGHINYSIFIWKINYELFENKLIVGYKNYFMLFIFLLIAFFISYFLINKVEYYDKERTDINN